MDVEVITSLEAVEPAQWNALNAAADPFLRHEFLVACERHGCVSADSGWEPRHLLLRSQGRLIGAMPLYLRHDSWGEFVFDWSWARAWERLGLPYYPKLTSAVPFTPATGERLLVAADCDAGLVRAALLEAVLAHARQTGVSSLHILFPTQAERALMADHELLLRKDTQFHWHNQGDADFEAFLARFSSAKRKKIRRERRRIEEQGISHVVRDGHQMTDELWAQAWGFSARTFLQRGRPPYLNLPFFQEIGRTMPEQVVVIMAEFDATPIAGAICFRSSDTLYGRYWGALEDFHSLHFETCYYQGIDYCLAHGLARFEPGTQGEHKIARGFLPVATGSAHWLADARLRTAVAHYLEQETSHISRYMDEVHAHSPYRRDPDSAT
jgi:predicted N-acyltransferase